MNTNEEQYVKYSLDNYGRRSGKDRRKKIIKNFVPERRVVSDRRVNTVDRRRSIIGRIPTS